MLDTDVDDVERLTATTYFALDVATASAQSPAPDRPRPPARAERWRQRARHLLAHDAGGCWVAEDEVGILGAALSLRRENLWALSSFAVLPRAQSRGVGKALLDTALRYSEGCLRGMILSSPDPRAARRYRLAGFTLHPTMCASGRVLRATLPVVGGVRPGSDADRDLLDSVDRQVRASAHGVDHPFISQGCALLIFDQLTGSGYAYVDADGSPYLVAATNRRIAQRLLWSALAMSSPDEQVDVAGLTADQEWAVDVALAAGLSLGSSGYLCLRHMRPPSPYVPSGHFL
jgi:GNAT superfamily N-acetyltransferase